MELAGTEGLLVTIVGNLLILAFAEQIRPRPSTQAPGRSRGPTLDNLRDDMELRQQELPDEHRVDAARRRAKDVFGHGDFDTALLTAAPVAACSRVRSRSGPSRIEIPPVV